jgi:hypothetical protein
MLHLRIPGIRIFEVHVTHLDQRVAILNDFQSFILLPAMLSFKKARQWSK